MLRRCIQSKSSGYSRGAFDNVASTASTPVWRYCKIIFQCSSQIDVAAVVTGCLAYAPKSASEIFKKKSTVLRQELHNDSETISVSYRVLFSADEILRTVLINNAATLLRKHIQSK